MTYNEEKSVWHQAALRLQRGYQEIRQEFESKAESNDLQYLLSHLDPELISCIFDDEITYKPLKKPKIQTVKKSRKESQPEEKQQQVDVANNVTKTPPVENHRLRKRSSAHDAKLERLKTVRPTRKSHKIIPIVQRSSDSEYTEESGESSYTEDEDEDNEGIMVRSTRTAKTLSPPKTRRRSVSLHYTDDDSPSTSSSSSSSLSSPPTKVGIPSIC